MANVTIKYFGSLKQTDPTNHPVTIIGQVKNLNSVNYDAVKCKFGSKVTEETWKAAVASLHPSPTDSCALWLNNANVAALPTKCSRHNTPSRSHSLMKIVKAYLMGGDEYFVIVCERSDAFASGCAIARALPLYSQKSRISTSKRTVNVEFLLVGSDKTVLSESELTCLSDMAQGIRLAAKIVDMPCSVMHTDAFLEEAQIVADDLGIKPVIIQGDELEERGFGGLHGVGKAAIHQPALCVLSHRPAGATKTIAWVGKGIVYDTGGLCIKGKTSMPGMKRDCGGAAAVLGAFHAAVKQGFTENLHALLCLAENAIGPEAQRPDDVVKLYSGRTVEINNTDAEGRLVLGDGVAYASKELKADVIVDIATLTGAQGIATGKYHAALLTNNPDWEEISVEAGRASGDLIHPVPYCPEIHFSEFSSAVADMKNSVADRTNAQVSCAGLFIGSHIVSDQALFEFPCTWLHIDMAYPVHCGERATGYGVGLLNTLFGHLSQSTLLQYVAPQAIDGESSERDENALKKIRLV
ncbi:probable aminopeptidase NPEPL1 [Lineus longissimus]|uniref:probable aminopeptidase NPEPL1 n=1 Tax=Lineus longissimus TaxID=88925 RepID=UPI002B4E4253